MENAYKLGKLAGAIALALAVTIGDTQASVVTFTYDCVPTSATVCGTAGIYGTVTLSDSIVDPNRVDLNVVLNGPGILALNPNFTGLNDFFLNYSGSVPANNSFKLVLQTDPAGTFMNTAGDGSVSFNNKGPFGTLDIDLDPVGSIPSLTYAGSLVLRGDAGPLHTEINLDVAMFDLLDENNLLYSAFNTMPTNQGSVFGARSRSSSSTQVPEPSTILLLAAALSALVFRRRART